MSEKEKLEAQIEILSLLDNPVIAYTGTLESLKQGSYIPYGQFLLLLNKLKKQLNTHL